MEKVRLEIIFYGSVQGVGFRYRAFHSARELGLTGTVENQYDGTVRCEVQGCRADINDMIKMINGGTYIEIEDTDIRELPLVDDEHDFCIIG